MKRRAPSKLSPEEAALLAARGADVSGSRVYRTATRVDAGLWFRTRRVSACAEGGGLWLFAAGPKPYVEKVERGVLGKSVYNHVTGEVVLLPAPESSLRRLRMPPVEGVELLEEIQKEGRHHA